MFKPSSLTLCSYWLLLLLGILLVKAIIYAIDPQLQFFMGDSASYLYTAITDWIPDDRSYTYGRFIRQVTLDNRFLGLLVPAQVILSALSCLLLAVVLVRYLACSPSIAAAAGLICAVDPVQLMYERYAMAETASLCVFAAFLLALLQYLRRGNLLLLVAITALGVLAISLRTAYLPPVLGLITLALGWRTLFRSADPDDQPQRWSPWVTGLVHILVFAATFLSLQHYEAGPRKHSETGLFLLASWSPLLAKPELAPILEQDPILTELTRDLPCDLNRLDNRTAQLWLPDCLIGRIRKHFPDRHQGNAYAKDVAMKLLAADPIGVLQLGGQTWLHIWEPLRFAGILRRDRGDAPLPQDFIDLVQKHYDTDVTGRHATETLTNRLYLNASWWHYWINLSPFLLLLWWLTNLSTLNPYSLVIAAASVILLVVVTALIVGPSIRFFHPISWLSIIGAASIIDRLRQHCRRPATRAANS